MRRVRAKPWVAETSKHSQFGIVRWMIKYFLKGENKLKYGGWHAINKIDDCGESMRLKM